MAEGNFVYLTRERIVEIEKELFEMKTKGRKEMAEKIAQWPTVSIKYTKRAMRMGLVNDAHQQALDDGWRAILGVMGGKP